MARTILGLSARWDPEDREAFEREVERILARYGDQPHLRAKRDAEIEQAAATFAACAYIELATKNG